MIVTETRKFLIRELTLDDVPGLAAILGDPAVMRYSTGGVRSEGETRQFVEWCMASYAVNGLGQWALVEKASSLLVGFCGLSPVTVDGHHEIEIGYRLAAHAWGRGIATEAAAQVLAYGFEQKELESIIAMIAPDHGASIRVAEKAGFSSFVCSRYAGWDVRVYRKRLEEWRSESDHRVTGDF